MSAEPVASAVDYTLTGRVVDLRHRGRYLFFTGLLDDGGATHQLLFKSVSAEGAMADDELRQMKRSLRPGDELRVHIHATEPEGEKSVLHVSSATVLSLSVRSNTGEERTIVPEKRPGGELPPLPQPPQPKGSLVQDEEIDRHEVDGAPHTERARVFGEWVLEMFGSILDVSSDSGGDVGIDGGGRGDGSRAGILDVAGGKGELAMHLTLAGQSVTLVDPRPNSGFLSKWQRKRLRKSGQPPFRVLRALFGEAGGEAGMALAHAAKVVVGMHPDEVTEAIVDAAIAARTPFAVVPCCVFSRLFPSRRLRSGEPVASHPSFVRYLCEKHPNARTACLGFAGKSTVVYVRDYGERTGAYASGVGMCEPCDASDVTSIDT